MQTTRSLIIGMTAAADHTQKEGYFVVNSSGSVAVASSATSTIPIGAIVTGAANGGTDLIAMPGAPGVKVMVGGSGATATANGFGVLQSDGSVIDDPGSGARMQVCRFLESGVTGARVSAVLIAPRLSVAGAIAAGAT